ncbi:SEC14-like protein 2 like protein [Argiope bruennichi]|uniref:SEC14-like protein 2 like protein n=1 Tax=Argiope bruennichi TaxID=94029 RepID=A0A8T0EKI5_ARGBR|nr:SEC14-like protein 2 like protein [Argiope bruennichi]
MSGYLGDLSSSQEQALKELREIFKDELLPQHDDHLLLQFLRARRFDMKKTEEMFRKHLEFRKEFPEDYFVNEYKPPKILVDHLIPPVLGYDKDGCPIRLVHIGHQDIKGLLCCVRRPEIRKCITWFLDTDKKELRKRSRETGIHVEKRTFIFDLDGLSLKQIYRRDVYELAISFIKLYEYNYPENLKIAFIINTPSFFYYLFNMIKALLSEDTVDKLKIYGYNGWKPDLLEHIDAELLPVIYGGTRTDPDGNPNCPSLVRVFSPVPKEFYLKNLNTLSADDENVRKVTVGRRSKCSIQLKVDFPGSTVGWEVECTRNDIKIYLVYAEGPSPEIVMKPITVSSDFGAEIGCYLAERAGKYSLVLDNSYSIFRNKQVLYKTFVTSCSSKSADAMKTVLSEKENS